MALDLLPAAAGAGPDPWPSLPSAGSVHVFPVVLCSPRGQNVLGLDFSDCVSSHPRITLKALSLRLFCYRNGLAVVQFSLAVMPTWYVLHYLWHNSNTIIKNPLNHANEIILSHIYMAFPKAISHSHEHNLSSENPRQSLISELKIYQLTSLESLVKRSPPRRKSSIRYNFPSV